MSLRAHENAWKAALEGATTKPWFLYDEIPANPPAMYGTLSVTRRAVDSTRMDGRRRQLGWRLQTKAWGTSHSEVQWVRERVMLLSDEPLPSIEATRLLPDGESDAPEEDRGGIWSALDSWVYTAPNPVI